MLTKTLIYDNRWKTSDENETILKEASIVFIFGNREDIKEPKIYKEIRALFPDADIVGCSSSGNIIDGALSEASVVATAVYFEKGTVQLSVQDFTPEDNVSAMAEKIIHGLPSEGLKHVFLLSDGLNINGSCLAKGANSALKGDIAMTGGLAGDGTDFEETWVIANDVAKQNRLVAIGFYGESLHISSGCFAGWDEFGIYRRITKSEGNVVYEIDNQPALDLYKKYLGTYANELPGSGLRFPFNVKKDENTDAVIRSILAVNEEEKSLFFAGDVEEGSYARLMKTDIDGLIDGSEVAASRIKQFNDKPALGLVVSCVGRRVILNQLTDEEIEAISDILGENVALTGFYSYGELAPHSNEILSCRLHNQTMTLTTIYEE